MKMLWNCITMQRIRCMHIYRYSYVTPSIFKYGNIDYMHVQGLYSSIFPLTSAAGNHKNYLDWWSNCMDLNLIVYILWKNMIEIYSILWTTCKCPGFNDKRRGLHFPDSCPVNSGNSSWTCDQLHSLRKLCNANLLKTYYGLLQLKTFFSQDSTYSY